MCSNYLCEWQFNIYKHIIEARVNSNFKTIIIEIHIIFFKTLYILLDITKSFKTNW